MVKQANITAKLNKDGILDKYLEEIEKAKQEETLKPKSEYNPIIKRNLEEAPNI